MIKLLGAHPILLFFTLTYLLSWLIWVPMALDHFSLLPFRLNEGFVTIVRLFGTLGPAISAILVAGLAGGGQSIRTLLSQIGRWRVRWTWYAAAGLVFPALLFGIAWIYSLIPGLTPLPFQQVSLSSMLVTVIVMTVSVGYLPITTLVPAYIMFMVVAWIIAIGLLGRFGSKRLVRQDKVAVASFRFTG